MNLETIGTIAGGKIADVDFTTATKFEVERSDGTSFYTDLAQLAGVALAPALQWTPTDASGAALSLTLNNRRYVQIGKLLIAFCDVTYPATGSGLAAIIGGLPGTMLAGNAPGFIGFTSASVVVRAYCDNTNRIFLNNGAGANVLNSDMSAKRVVLGVAYLLA